VREKCLTPPTLLEKGCFNSYRNSWCYDGIVFPVSPTLVVYFLFIHMLLAMGIGAAAGVVASFCLRLPMRGILTDALLGAAGFLAAFAIIIVVRPLGNALANHFSSPMNVALAVATIFPLSRTIFRLRYTRSR
jgi:hypothetical protein